MRREEEEHHAIEHLEMLKKKRHENQRKEFTLKLNSERKRLDSSTKPRLFGPKKMSKSTISTSRNTTKMLNQKRLDLLTTSADITSMRPTLHTFTLSLTPMKNLNLSSWTNTEPRKMRYLGNTIILTVLSSKKILRFILFSVKRE